MSMRPKDAGMRQTRRSRGMRKGYHGSMMMRCSGASTLPGTAFGVCKRTRMTSGCIQTIVRIRPIGLEASSSATACEVSAHRCCSLCAVRVVPRVAQNGLRRSPWEPKPRTARKGHDHAGTSSVSSISSPFVTRPLCSCFVLFCSLCIKRRPLTEPAPQPRTLYSRKHGKTGSGKKEGRHFYLPDREVNLGSEPVVLCLLNGPHCY